MRCVLVALRVHHGKLSAPLIVNIKLDEVFAMIPPSVHDNNVYAYSVLAESEQIILYTESNERKCRGFAAVVGRLK